MIYAVMKHVIFDVPESELDGGKIERLVAIIGCQMSYFGQLDSVNALIGKHLDADNPYGQVFQIHQDGFGKDHPRAPIRKWFDLDDDFKDLVEGRTNLNPNFRRG
ncbi:hypothetical protein P152DRAFT_454349 [Eremomyces bilateralis CBS 781.70]|uniref:Uncharacterized protein n=1 Tax=Eremomyces bilateralis CBS 781.70 TaxID=1392243 RepID=A0A6G1GDC9_9PEZI|nr:uncharacterized protein P152DRAFT_454349 [Eremomyces bilateralis CBS 781.70]KAF1816107.1 hypothetical protein P152DRAFT_454349 [Eremomyces bilateralis CBS 781.70]